MRIHARRAVLGRGADLRLGPVSLAIEAGRIISVEPRSSHSDPGDIDLGDLLLTPAFVDAHTHLAMVAFRGLTSAAALAGNVVEDLFFRLESALVPGDVRAFTRVGAHESLRAGVACVWDHYYAGLEVAQGLRDAGLAGVVAPTLQDLAGPGHAGAERALDATLQIAESRSLAEAGIYAAVGPHATDTVSPALWRQAASLARRLGLPLHAHLAQSHEELTRIRERHGCSPAALLEREGVLSTPAALFVHGIYLDRADLSRLDPGRHVLGYCPSSQAQFCFPARATAWTEAGLRWLVASDCAASNDAMNPQRELRLAAALPGLAVSHGPAYGAYLDGDTSTLAEIERARAGAVAQLHHDMAPSSLLAKLWSIPGDLHPGAPCGALEPGRMAHLAVWDLEHPSTWPAPDPLRTLAHSETAPALRGLCVAGRWRIPPGQDASVLDADFAEALVEARERRRALLRRAGIDR